MNALQKMYEKDGFLIVQSGLPESDLDAARDAHGPLQPAEYHYNPQGKRVFEAWKTSQAVRDIAYAPAILAHLRELFGEEPRPNQTINFDRGSNQPLHQDGIHFQTWPSQGGMVGVWVALEDMDGDNGPLCYVPGSHKMGFKGWQALGFQQCKVGEQFAQYHLYEKWAEAVGKAWGGKHPFLCQKGEAFIWGLDLLHGGWPVKDPARTRHSQVTHYQFPSAKRGYAPMFSDTAGGGWHWKKMRWFDVAGNRSAS